MTEISEPKDLFGLPLLEQPSRRGRRRLVFQPQVYEKVETLRAGGMSQEDIALTLRISVPTLTKYFGPELEEAPVRRKAEALELLAAQARKGNVSAIKAYMAELDKQAAAHAVRERERPSRPAPAPKLGKKEERREAAKSVGGIFETPAGPQLVVNNA